MYIVWQLNEDETIGMVYRDEAHRHLKPWEPLREYQLKYPLSIDLTQAEYDAVLDEYSAEREIVYL